MSEGVSDMHCMSDEYLVQELEVEQKNSTYCENNTILIKKVSRNQ